VHKGLDVLLEAVAADPGLSLDVCGDVGGEPDFARAYRGELHESPNIRVHGFVDVTGPGFGALQAACGAMVLPSCAEGQAGTVTVAMAFGLPCLVSRACGFDHPEIAMLPDCAPDTIRDTLRARAAEGREALARRSEQTLALYRRAYRPAHYAAAVRAALRDVLARRGAIA